MRTFDSQEFIGRTTVLFIASEVPFPLALGTDGEHWFIGLALSMQAPPVLTTPLEWLDRAAARTGLYLHLMAETDAALSVFRLWQAQSSPALDTVSYRDIVFGVGARDYTCVQCYPQTINYGARTVVLPFAYLQG